MKMKKQALEPGRRSSLFKVVKSLAEWSLCPRASWKKELKSDDLGFLEEKSKQHSIQSDAWLLLIVSNKTQEWRNYLNVEFIIKRQAENEDMEPFSIVM